MISVTAFISIYFRFCIENLIAYQETKLYTCTHSAIVDFNIITIITIVPSGLNIRNRLIVYK